MSTLARWLNIDVQTIWSWIQGNSVPQLAQLLCVCSRLGISPLAVFTHQPDITKSFDAKAVAQQSDSPYAVAPRTLISRPEEIKTALENALHEEPPVSFSAVARQIGKSRGSIKYQFKEECEALIERYHEWRRSDKKQPTSNSRVRGAVATDLAIQHRLKQATMEELPVSLAQVARELKCNADTLKKWYPTQCALIQQRYRNSINIDWIAVERALHKALQIPFPPYPSLADLSRQVGVLADSIRGRYPEECREILRRHRHQNVDIMQRELQRAVSEEPPPSLSEVCVRCGHADGTLKLHFPKLCEEIVYRRAAFVQESSLQRAQRLRTEVRQAVLRIHEEGRYPSLGRLYIYLNHSLILMEPACREEWRATLEELGYDVDDDE